MPVLFLKLFAGLRSKLNLLILAGKHFHETEQESNLFLYKNDENHFRKRYTIIVKAYIIHTF